MLESSEIKLSKYLCEQKRNQILSIMMLSMENPRVGGYMLTGNRSMFLSTNGSFAWLYHCPLMRSPPHEINQCEKKSLSSTKMQSSSSTQSPDKLIQRHNFKIDLTGSSISFISTWKIKTFVSLLHPL